MAVDRPALPETLDPLRLPLFGSRLIEASAGTGKTFTIAALYLRLVLGHGGDAAFERALLPPDILVVTFTDAATKELRDRIRQRLTEAAEYFAGNLAEADPFLEQLRASYAEPDWPKCARRLRLAADWMDEAAVSTIHAWCSRMLREHAFDSGSLFAQNLEADHRELLLEVVRDYWRAQCYSLDGDALAWVLEHWGAPAALAGKLALDTAEAPETLPPLAAVFEAWQRRRAEHLTPLKAPWAGWADEIEALLDAASEAKAFNGSKLKPANYKKWLQTLRDWAADANLDWPALTKSAWSRLTPEGLADAWKGDAPSHPAIDALAGLPTALAALPKPEKSLLAHASAWIHRRFQREKSRRGEMGFDDLLNRLDEALRGRKGDQLATCIRRQFPIALIDEFQDTDPIQYGIFSRIYALADNARSTGIFLIGDPKQAIYAFRNADIHTYLQARRATTGRHYTLGTNFRATTAMVAAANRVFEHAENRATGRGAFLFRERTGENPIPFQPVAARGRRERLLIDGTAPPALTLWHPADCTQGMGKTAYLALMATACADEIARLLNMSAAGRAGFSPADGSDAAPLSPGDFAVLVRSYSQARLIREALARREVRSVYLSDKDSVLMTAEAADLRHWLRACAEPDDERRLRAALATASLALPLAALEHLNGDENAWEARVLQFRRYRQMWREQGVLPMLRRLIHDFGMPQRLAGHAAGERALTNLLHLFELLQQSAAEVEGEQALIRLFCEQIADATSGEQSIMRLESDERLVKVVTIHKAKGLEYPLVFVPFACHFRAIKKDDAAIRLHSSDGRRQTVIAPDEGEIARADDERLAEDTRLLYVALTRARHACWLGIADLQAPRGKASELHLSAFGYLLTGGEPLPAPAQLPVALDHMRGACADIAIVPLADQPPEIWRDTTPPPPNLTARQVRRPPAENPWWIASYSALKIGPVAAPDNGEAPQNESAGLPAFQFELELIAPDTPLAQKIQEVDEATTGGVPAGADLHGFPRGAGPGTFLHGLLEWAAREGFAAIAAQAARLDEAIARRCERRGWQTWQAPLQAWLRHLLGTPLPLPGETLRLADLADYQPELEFWFETRSVDTQALDRLVTAHTLDAAPRPALAPNSLDGMLKGFMDLVFEHRGRYYVADYKSNHLGPDDAAYTPQAMAAAVLEKRYDLQYALYLLALHRQLRARLPDYDYERHIGGAVYLFLRGGNAPSRGVHFERPPYALIEAMDALFQGQAVETES